MVCEYENKYRKLGIFSHVPGDSWLVAGIN